MRLRLLTIAGLLVLAAPSHAQSVLQQIEREVSSIARQARGGVVTIEDMRAEAGGSVRTGADEGKPLRSLKGLPMEQPDLSKTPSPAKNLLPAAKVGSGFVIEPEFVVTTADVLEGMERPTIVTDSGQRYRGTVVQIDHELNIGLLRMPSAAKITPMKIGSSASVQTGQFAIAIGNQAGQPNAVAITIVSGFRKEGSFAGRRFYPTLMQVAGSLGAGSSGAPLLNSKAEVIGMLVAVTNPSTEDKTVGQAAGGYALPIDDVRATAKLMTNVKVYLRSWLGADLREEARVENKADGTVQVVRTVWVEAIHPDSPAQKAGLLRGDQFLTMNESPILRMGDIRAAVVRIKFNEKLRFTIRRGTQEVTAVVPFAVRPVDSKGKF